MVEIFKRNIILTYVVCKNTFVRCSWRCPVVFTLCPWQLSCRSLQGILLSTSRTFFDTPGTTDSLMSWPSVLSVSWSKPRWACTCWDWPRLTKDFGEVLVCLICCPQRSLEAFLAEPFKPFRSLLLPAFQLSDRVTSKTIQNKREKGREGSKSSLFR